MKRIGDILLEAGVIHEGQLKKALDQRKPGERLGALLVRLGLISEETLVKALARQLKLPVLDLKQLEIPEKVLNLIPRDFLYQYSMLPVTLRMIAGKNHLILAMADPTLVQVVALLEGQVPYAIRTGVAAESEIHAALTRYLGPRPAALRPPDPVDELPDEVAVETQTVTGQAKAEEDTEVTMLTQPPTSVPDPEVMKELTEPTHPGIRLSGLTPPPAPSGAKPVSGKDARRADLRDFVQQANKNLLLEGLIQLLIDRKVIQLEDLMAAVELRK